MGSYKLAGLTPIKITNENHEDLTHLMISGKSKNGNKNFNEHIKTIEAHTPNVLNPSI